MTTQVLVFESDASFAQELEVGLAEYDCQTTVVDDANTGLQTAASDKPDLILLSIELPRMNGFSVCNKLKRDASLKDVPLIIMSSDSTEETFEQHRRLRTRAEDYVHKPISVGDLVSHIQELLPLQSNTEGDESIIIDDDIEIEDADSLEEIDDDLEIEDAELSSAGGRDAPVDQEVDDFTEQAFGALMGSGSMTPEPQAVEADAAFDVAHEVSDLELEEEEVEVAALSEPPRHVQEETALGATSLSSSASAAAPAGAAGRFSGGFMPDAGFIMPDAAVQTVASQPLRELEEQLGAANERILELESEAVAKRRSDAEVVRLEKEVHELRQKLASGKSGGSAREFLDLREQLNSKDKEILELRDQLNHREKELLGLRDSSLGLEREKADLDDRVVELERKLHEVSRTSDALRDDKEQASKRADDFKRKAEKLKAEIDAKAQAAEAVAAQYRQELAASEAGRTALIEAQQKELADAVREAEARHAEALEAAVSEARQQAVTELRAEADADKAQALRAREAELKSEHDSKLGALHRSNEESLAKLRAEQEQASKEALEHADRQLAARVQELESTFAAKLSELTQQKAEGEALRDARIDSLQAELTAQNQEAERTRAEARERQARLAEQEAELASLRKQNESAEANASEQRERIADLDAALSEQNEEYAALASKLQERASSMDALEADLVATRQHLKQATERTESERSKVERARQKWADDRASLERAKDALAAALAQLEETETRSLD